MLHRIYGRSKSGKTERILSIVKELIEKKQHAFLIVPEQQAMLAEREIINRFGNQSNMYIEVINFKRLCNRVFRETGGISQKYMGEPEELLIMAEALESVSDSLAEYNVASKDVEFAQKALSAINEMKQFGVSPQMLEKASEKLKDGKSGLLASKLCDLSLIYSAYNAHHKEGFDDSSDDLDRLCEVLAESDFFKGKTVLVDSFYGFTVQEKRILFRTISSAEDVYITFLLDESKKGELFERSVSAFNTLYDYASNVGIKVDDEYLAFAHGYDDSSLEMLERNFCAGSAARSVEVYEGKPNGVSVVRCENPFREADATCAIIKELVMQKNARYGEIAVCARSIDSLSGVIDTALEKNSIPYNFNTRRELLSRPIVAYILSAFEIMRTHWQQQSVIKYIKTGLTELTDEEADLFECYVKAWSITGSRFLEDEWEMNPDCYTEILSKRGEYIIGVVNVAKQKLTASLCSFIDEVKNAKTCNDISTAVYNLICKTKRDENGNLVIDSPSEVVYRNLTMDALDCLASVVGEQSITPTRYASLFKLVMSAYDTGKIPATIDEVTVSSAEGLRGIGIKYVILLGANDGVFPANTGEDTIFSDREKLALRELGIELSMTVTEAVNDELFLAYKALTCARNGVYVLYSNASTAGDEQGESIIISIIKNIFPNLVEEEFPFSDGRRFMFSKRQLLDMSFRTNNNEERIALGDFFSNDEEYAELYGSCSKKLQPPDYLDHSTTEKMYNESIILSPSRLESFRRCAFSYYGNYILRLKPEKVAELGAIETGNIAHRILELLVMELTKNGTEKREIESGEAERVAKRLLEEQIALLCGKNKTTKRFEFLYNKLSGTVCLIAEHLAQEMNQSEFLPKDFELEIGHGDVGIRSAEIPLPDGNGRLLINGKIDRTDIFVKDGKVYVRVVDYKTGKKKFKLSDVALGINLQMLLYLYSIVEQGKGHFGGEIVPAGVLYIPARQPSASVSLGEDKSGERADKANGVLIHDEEILRAMERELKERYIPVKKNNEGVFTSSSSIMELAELGRLLNTAADVASKLAFEIKKGNIRKNPIKCKEANSCTNCELAPVCRYENGKERHTRFSIPTYSNEQFRYSFEKEDDENAND